jgi:hypothetical protein
MLPKYLKYFTFSSCSWSITSFTGNGCHEILINFVFSIFIEYVILIVFSAVNMITRTSLNVTFKQAYVVCLVRLWSLDFWNYGVVWMFLDCPGKGCIQMKVSVEHWSNDWQAWSLMFVWIIHKTSQKTRLMSITNTNHLVLFSNVTALNKLRAQWGM